MRHVILTCQNHPNLRWSCKEIAITNGRYNGARNLFFMGEPRIDAEGNTQMQPDGSGLLCDKIFEIRDSQGLITGYRMISKCKCTSSFLVVAPEDSKVKR